MNPLKRARLFMRDYFDEFGIAWSVARYRDCERAGGHRWGQADFGDGMMVGWRTCRRCKCSESVARTSRTGDTTLWASPR